MNHLNGAPAPPPKRQPSAMPNVQSRFMAVPKYFTEDKDVKIKKGLAVFIAACILSSVTGAFAADANDTRAVIGADLTEENIADVYAFFG
jgi:hypothetical protein